MSHGRLKANELPSDMKNYLMAHLSELPKGLLGGVDNKTDEAVLDTGATHMSTPDRDDFIEFKEAKTPTRMDGIASGLEIKGSGIVRYELLDKDGKVCHIEKEAFYFPGLSIRLIPP